MKHGIRLEQCGDLLTVQEYSAWVIQSANTTYQQVHSGSTLVRPFSLNPLRWRRSDCEAKLAQRDVVIEQRKARAKRRMRLAHPA